MKITIELEYGPQHSPIVYADNMNKNIKALERLANNAAAEDVNIIMDTISILEGIRRQLPGLREVV